MRPMDSSYDRSMAQADADMRALIDPAALEAGDIVEYETAEQVADPAWRTLESTLRRRGLVLVDEGNGWRVSGRRRLDDESR